MQKLYTFDFHFKCSNTARNFSTNYFNLVPWEFWFKLRFDLFEFRLINSSVSSSSTVKKFVSKLNKLSLFRKKRFMLDEMFQRKASKFAIFFFILCHFIFSPCLMNALVYVDIEKIKWHEMKNEKNYMGFRIPKKWQIWSVLLDHFTKHKLLFSEEWYIFIK